MRRKPVLRRNCDATKWNRGMRGDTCLLDSAALHRAYALNLTLPTRGQRVAPTQHNK